MEGSGFKVVPGEPASKNEAVAAGHVTRVAMNMRNVLRELCSTDEMGKKGFYRYSFWMLCCGGSLT